MIAKTVIVVDDQPAVRLTVERTLEHAGGYDVQLFETADEARAGIKAREIQKQPISLVLLDVMLGPASSLSGEQFLEWLAARRPPLQTVVMSGRLSAYALLDLVLRGASDFLVKPFAPHDLLATVERHAADVDGPFQLRHDAWADMERNERDVFLSYCEQDRVLAAGLKRLLERAGISAWCAALDLPPEHAWAEHQRNTALDRCRACLALLTPEAIGSETVNAEIERAAARREKEQEAFLLVALTLGLNPEKLPAALARAQCHDFADRTQLADSFESLANTFRLFLRRPPE